MPKNLKSRKCICKQTTRKINQKIKHINFKYGKFNYSAIERLLRVNCAVNYNLFLTER